MCLLTRDLPSLFFHLLMTFTDRQLELIADAVEDYAVLIDEDAADECGEILDIIEAHFYNKNFKK